MAKNFIHYKCFISINVDNFPLVFGFKYLKSRQTGGFTFPVLSSFDSVLMFFIFKQL